MSGTCSILNNTMDCDYYYKEKINRKQEDTPHTKTEYAESMG